MKLVTENKTIGELVSEFQSDSIKHDPSFQRYACWSLSNKQEYIECIYKGHHPGTFLFASTDQQGKDRFDDYFPSLKAAKYKLVSIDGNNRSTALTEFVENKFPIKCPHSNDMKYFKDFDPSIQEEFLITEVHAIVYTECTRAECSDIFLAHNTSTEVSKQEKRNARGGAIATLMRAYEPEGVPFFKPNNEKRQNDQWVLQMLSILNDNKLTPNEKVIDVTWDLPSDTLVPLFERTKDIFGMLIEFFKDETSHRKAHTLGITSDVFTAISLLTANGEEYSKANLKKIVWGVASEHIRAYRSNDKIMFDGDETTFAKQFKSVTLSAGQWHDRKRLIVEMLLNPVLRGGDIQPYNKRVVDTSDPNLRYTLAKLQDYTCSLTGKNIGNPADGQEWEVDHIVPLAIGGPDVISNMQLVCKTANRQKGDRAA